VVPIGLSEDGNLIVRCITPVISQPVPTQKDVSFFGFGDMVPSFFLSPSKPGALIWGFGPVFQLPTATSYYTGQGEIRDGAVACSLDSAWTMDHWRVGQQHLVDWRAEGSSSSQPVSDAVLH